MPADNDNGEEERTGAAHENGRSDFDGPRDRFDRDMERDNACHLHDSGEQIAGELAERAGGGRDTSLDFLSGNDRTERSNQSGRPDFTFDADISGKGFNEYGNSIDRTMVNACEQYEKMLKGFSPNMRDMLAGVSGACKMVETRVEMLNDPQKMEGVDKFYHCMANCRAVEYGGVAGAGAALVIDSAKEAKDVFKRGIADSYQDFKANFEGLRGGLSGQRCYDVCGDRLPKGYK
jgi:hypothetical protein